MKASFKNYSIEFNSSISGSQLNLKVSDELIKVIDIKDPFYNINDFKKQSAVLFKQDIQNVEFSQIYIIVN